MLPIVLIAGALGLARSAITFEQAQSLSPAALGERLLSEPHRPIVEKNIHGEGGPPPAPGAPVETEIQLWDAAHNSAVPGFCEKTRYVVFLESVVRAANGSLPPAVPARLAQNATYRWNPGHEDGGCEGRNASFFALRREADAQPVFAAIRLLAAARDAARSHRPLEFGGRMDDALGRETATMIAKNPSFVASLKDTNPEALVPMSDWRSALASYPVESVVAYFLDDPINPQHSSGARRVVVNAAGHGGWMQATMLIEGGRIVAIDLKRFMPSPF